MFSNRICTRITFGRGGSITYGSQNWSGRNSTWQNLLPGSILAWQPPHCNWMHGWCRVSKWQHVKKNPNIQLAAERVHLHYASTCTQEILKTWHFYIFLYCTMQVHTDYLTYATIADIEFTSSKGFTQQIMLPSLIRFYLRLIIQYRVKASIDFRCHSINIIGKYTAFLYG